VVPEGAGAKVEVARVHDVAGMEERELATRWAALFGRNAPSAGAGPSSAADAAAAARKAKEAAELEARRRETARRDDDACRREQRRGPHM